MWWFELFLLMLVIMEVFPREASSRPPDIYWNTTNPIFRIDNTDHIFDVNKDNSPFEYDQVNIICPVYPADTPDEETEKYMIYNVSKEEYDTCRIMDPNPRTVAICNKPKKLMYFTITFRPFTPQPGGMEFHPGQDYYFISTSSKDDIYRRIGGRCSSDNMKTVFKVCCRAKETNNQTTAATGINLGPVHHFPVTTSGTYSSTQAYMPPQLPTRPTRPPSSKDYPPMQPPKKSSEYDKHPNEVLKNEELTYSGASACSWSSSILLWSLLAASQALLTYSRR
ncbi:ephrin-A4 isoform X2 [Neocloeon triangulifer]|uniref:ephrin-A4 isoform X2 n=1 Tax=Neocloeon triangulifer TaxID=2078957 RepID=UPI00286F8376|nr:ephrin-A4 isoform X2 [Neocloeon triangulifer]